MTSETVVVTGAAAGLGRATARGFAAHGDRVALLARGIDDLEGAVGEIEAAGGTALAIPTDVADAQAVERAAERAERQLGPIGVWVNCAMATVFAPLADLTPDEYRAKWGLAPDYPMVAPRYAEQRSEFAKKIGLGRGTGRNARGAAKK